MFIEYVAWLFALAVVGLNAPVVLKIWAAVWVFYLVHNRHRRSKS